MRLAIPIWTGRVSPVFDVAKELLLVDADGGVETDRQVKPLTPSDPTQRAGLLGLWGVEVLICGAISWPLEAMLAAASVKVIPHICGQTEDVLTAFHAGQLTDPRYLMPGCAGRRRRRRRGRGRDQMRGEPL